MDSITITAIVGAFVLLLNIFLTHLRKVEWFIDKFRWTFVTILLFIGITGLIFGKEISFVENGLFLILSIPFILTIIDRILKVVSIKTQGRDFYFNTILNWTINQFDDDFSFIDQIMTVTMLLTIVGLTIISAIY
jgi:hypothetical protein